MTVVEQGRQALRRGDGAEARRLFEAAIADDPAPELLEALSRALYLQFEFAESTSVQERAYALYREAGDGAGAVRVARMLGFMHGAILGDAAVMQGWLARARTLLDGSPDSVERGWVALTHGMFAADREDRDAHLREALDVARRHRDRDLEFVALAYLGASLVHADRTEEGMVLLDEACAAVAGQEVDDFFFLEEIFCQLFSACEHCHDVSRADQWIRIAEKIVSQRSLPSVAAFCRTHYGGILTAAGRWDEADAALTEAVRIWGLGWQSLRGGALIRLADLRVRQGRYEEAGQLLEGLELHAEAARPLAALYLARGDAALAAEVLTRALGEMEPDGASAGPLWALLVDVHLSRNAIEEATAAVEGLIAVARRSPTHHLRALAALARGRLCMAEGTGEAKACLHEALGAFTKAQMPVEIAHVRLELANALATEQPQVALAEATAALDAFERLQAARHADSAAAVLRTLGGPARTGPKGGGTLTRREADVLELLGEGLSNPQIAERLYISRKTVEHHVTNVLAKLGLRSRAEAAVYAVRMPKTSG